MDSPNPDGAAPRPMFTPAQIRALKIAVIGMGVVLLAGFALVIGRIIYLVNSAPSAEAVQRAAVAAAPAPLALPAGAVVRQIAISGNRLAVHYEAPSGAGLRVLDLATGAWGPPIPVVAEPSGALKRP